MIKPVLLEIQGVRSFKDHATIIFPANGAMLISGRYKDSSVSSGSGKSTVLMSLAYALGFAPIPATELKTWGAKTLYVSLVLSDGEKRYTITRDPKLKLIVDSNGTSETYDGTAGEEMLSKIINAPAELAKVLTYRVQREPGVFISATDSQKKEMLSTLLGLTAIETAHEQVRAEINMLETKVAQLVAKAEILKAQAQASYVDQSKINELHAIYTQTYNRVVSLQSVDVKTLENQILVIRQEIDRCMRASQESAAARSEIGSLDRNIEQFQYQMRSFQEGICPTCKQSWYQSDNAMVSAETQILSLRAKKSELESIIKNAQILESSIPALRTQEHDASGRVYSQTAPLRDAQVALQSAKTAFDQASNQVNVYNSLLSSAAVTEGESQKTGDEIVVSRHLDEVLGRNGFMSVIFDEVLEEIERLSNDMMTEIPNVCEFSLRIDSTSTTKSGNTKKTISTVLYKDGREVSVKSLSGGQACALDLVVDLAISDAIRRRSGTKLGWIALDEAMDGLDIETKRAALDVIKRKVSGMLIIVDHSTEIKESFETVIDVEFDGRYSRLL